MRPHNAERLISLHVRVYDRHTLLANIHCVLKNPTALKLLHNLKFKRFFFVLLESNIHFSCMLRLVDVSAENYTFLDSLNKQIKEI
jgi:hypothetical protein